MASTVLEAFARWTDAQDDSEAVPRFRRVFAAIWVAYDAIDLIWGMTERSMSWLPHEGNDELVALKLALVISGVFLASGRHVWASGMIAAAARALEAFQFLPLNDFYFVTLVYALLAHSDGGPFDRGKRPRWVRDALLAQLAWMYVMTGVLKLNADWLNGGQIYVRSQYLWTGHGWPYPAPIERALSSLSVDAWLSRVGAAMEISVGVVLAARRPYWLAAALTIGIHGVGALVTNVWFFSGSMVAGVLVLMPRRPKETGPEIQQT